MVSHTKEYQLYEANRESWPSISTQRCQGEERGHAHSLLFLLVVVLDGLGVVLLLPQLLLHDSDVIFNLLSVNVVELLLCECLEG